MDPEPRLFLTPSEALEAMRIDFEQYAPQTHLLRGLVPRVWGPRALVSTGAGADEFWLRTQGAGPLERVTGKALGDRILERLTARPPPLETLCVICRQVFRQQVVAGSFKGKPGLWIDTGMADFTCRRCGHCCRDLVYRDHGTAADYIRIEETCRRDILARMVPVYQEGRLIACRFWIDPSSGLYSQTCPWLEPRRDEVWTCTIRNLRPDICRQYPGSRKHAEMTGCLGFRRDPPGGAGPKGALHRWRSGR